MTQENADNIKEGKTYSIILTLRERIYAKHQIFIKDSKEIHQNIFLYLELG